ncbi:LapA family protein [Pseudomonas sp. SJZ131]|uniref:LapA family protein n=1 Tax=Pseudomonas sp. SJZ131 TaxID=2572895 RepID=UPI00273FB775|nr:LapA family protein [Pseudomonas sp. SJZ131]
MNSEAGTGRMGNFKRVFEIVVFLSVVLISIAFILENNQLTSLIFFGWTSPQLPLAVYIVLFFLLGMAIGPVLFWLAGRRFDSVRRRSNKVV